jgi:hypothetical protein
MKVVLITPLLNLWDVKQANAGPKPGGRIVMGIPVLMGHQASAVTSLEKYGTTDQTQFLAL